MKLGDMITIDKVYRRHTHYRPSKHGAWDITVKKWEANPITPRTGIYLGKRTLANGTRVWEHEVGNVFEPEEFIPAMLVCFSTNENPVYVPIDAVVLQSQEISPKTSLEGA